MLPLLFRFISLLTVSAWLVGCASDSENIVMQPTMSQGKQPRRYLNIPHDTAYSPSFSFPKGARSIDDALYAFAPSALDQIKPYFRKAGVAYPPLEIVLIAYKDERKMELWARDNGKFKLIRPYNIKVVIAPSDPRLRPLDTSHPSLPVWTPELYDRITREIFAITGGKPPIKLAHSTASHPLYRPAN